MAIKDYRSPTITAANRALQSPNAWRVLVLLFAANGVQTQFDFSVEVDGSDKPACIAQALYRHY